MSLSPTRRAGASLIALLGVALGLNIRDISAAMGLPLPGLPIPFGGSLLDNLLAVLVAVLLAWWLKPRALPLADSLGLRWHGARGPLLVLLATLPCWIGLAALGHLDPAPNPLALLMRAFTFPLAEEILYRGLGFVFLVRVLCWPAWLAALPQALMFGAVHWLGAGGMEGGATAVQILALITVGGLAFAWLNHLDRLTLWSGLALHVSLNLAWSLFILEDAMALDWKVTTLRLAAAAMAVLTLACWRKPPSPRVA
ncbi:CPBP family intramembrane glutamic endopeptidase [Stenotrophomonas sp.]|uniref:CPBP family intramembrane glutamic endopeptidase n=1 Tax=Stenotrophomonas sp. TaxID=69392 RepID=UPI002FC8AF3B